MKKAVLILICCFPFWISAQIGLKAGLNYANISNTSDFTHSARSGFHAGLFIQPNPTKLFTLNGELLYSRQGYNYKNNTKTGSVDLDYISIPVMLSLNFTRYVSVMGGLQFSYLIDGKIDTIPNGNPSDVFESFKGYFNKLDFGAAVGLETHPVGGLLIGTRLNYSFGNLFDYFDSADNAKRSFLPKINARNNLFQVYIGWLLGGYDKY